MDNLIQYCCKFVNLTEDEKSALLENFEFIKLKRKEYHLQQGKKCDFVAFIDCGVVRHYHVKNGDEVTCDITLHNSFLTDFVSLTNEVPSNYNFQIMKNADIYLIRKEALFSLYRNHKNIETLGRKMAELVAKHTIEMAMSLAADKPEERVAKLLQRRPELFQEVPQKYLANLIGITPESLSRIRSRQNS